MLIRRVLAAAGRHPAIAAGGSGRMAARAAVSAMALALVAAVGTTAVTAAPRAAAAVAPSGVVAPLLGAEVPSFETIANHDELTSDHAKLFRLYWAFFGRSPDAGGALYWIEQRDKCLSLDVIADFFAASPEFVGRYGLVDDHTFIDVAYRNVLGRAGDPGGVAYWTDLLASDELSRGGVVLNVSLSVEFTGRHAYPSDRVPPRNCQLPDGRASGRAVDVTLGRPLATVAGLTIMAPAAVIERAGFHQSSHPGALAMSPAAPAPARLTTLPSRNRGTRRRGAIDIVTEPSTAITAPVAGTVARAGGYTLYCKYQDGYVVINPDGNPDLEVKMLHIQDVSVVPGQRVDAGDRVASRATRFPFRSQIDRLTGEPSWPHVHIEVVDPSIPRKSSPRNC